MLGATMQSLMSWNRGPKATSGSELVDTEGRTLPLRETSLTGEAGQGFARMTVVQRFANPHDEALEVTYRMPLPPEGAVSGYAFEVDGRKVVGVVEPKSVARETYEAAIASGRTAGLLEEERANIFTQRLGNLPPRTEIVATITVDMPLTWLPEGAWELRFPTVIGPRYVSAGDEAPVIAEAVGVRVSKGAMPMRAHVALTVRDALIRGKRPESPSHTITSETAEGPSPRETQSTRVSFTNEAGERLDRDVVVRWPVAALEIGLSLGTARPAARHRHAHHAYGALTLVPPRPSANARPVARDLVVLIDTSGSMGGFPLDTAKVAVGLLLESLSETDRFEVVEFNSERRAFRPGPTPATKAAKHESLSWVRKLSAGGATEMHTAVLEAMRSLRPGSQRQVVLVTDGYIGGEEEIVRTLLETLPDSCRLHFVGVGAAVNRSLALSMARAGRGVECVVSDGEDPERALTRLLRGTTGPVLTNVTLSGDAVVEHAPELLPDVFSGSPLRIAVKLAAKGGRLALRGETAEGPWEREIEVPPTGPGEGDQGLVALFARECVADLETRLSLGRNTRGFDREVESLGVTFQISTRLTSWVAVDTVVSTEPGGRSRKESVPQEVPHGTNVESFGLRAASEEGGAGGAPIEDPELDGYEDLATVVFARAEAPYDFGYAAGPRAGGGAPVRQGAPPPAASFGSAPRGTSEYSVLPAAAPAPQSIGAPKARSRAWLFALLFLLFVVLFVLALTFTLRQP